MWMRNPTVRTLALFLAPALLAARVILAIWLPGGLRTLRSRRVDAGPGRRGGTRPSAPAA